MQWDHQKLLDQFSIQSANDENKATAMFLNMAIDLVINTASNYLNEPAIDIIPVLTEILQTKVQGKDELIGFGVAKNETQTGSSMSGAVKRIENIIVEYKALKKQKTLVKVKKRKAKKIINRKRAGTNKKAQSQLDSHEQQSASDGVRSCSYNLVDAQTLREKADDKADSVIEKTKMAFEGKTREEFEKFVKKSKGKCVCIQDSETVLLVKRFSFSIGLHDRFAVTQSWQKTRFLSPARTLELSRRVCADALPPTTKTITTIDVDAINTRLSKERRRDVKKNLKLKGCQPPFNYEKSESITYFRQDMNGRPDLVLKAEDGSIVGIVECKSMAGLPEVGVINFMKKQAGFYMILLECVEGYLAICTGFGKKRTYHIYPVTETDMIKLNKDIIRLKENFNIFSQVYGGLIN